MPAVLPPTASAAGGVRPVRRSRSHRPARHQRGRPGVLPLLPALHRPDPLRRLRQDQGMPAAGGRAPSLRELPTTASTALRRLRHGTHRGCQLAYGSGVFRLISPDPYRQVVLPRLRTGQTADSSNIRRGATLRTLRRAAPAASMPVLRQPRHPLRPGHLRALRRPPTAG